MMSIELSITREEGTVWNEEAVQSIRGKVYIK